jgi:cytochrome c5
MSKLRPHTLATALLVLAGTAFAQSERLEEGRAAFDKHCKACHENTEAKAPTAGDADDWKNRSQLWQAVLFEHAEKGYLEMPPRGGAMDATDYEVEAAAEYMLTITHPDLPHD